MKIDKYKKENKLKEYKNKYVTKSLNILPVHQKFIEENKIQFSELIRDFLDKVISENKKGGEK